MKYLITLLVFLSCKAYSNSVISDYFIKKQDKSILAVTDFTPHGTQPGITNSILPINNCKNCHQGTVTDSTYLPYPSWAGSMMANSTRDPLFWAAVDVANNDVPGVGDFCIRCHAPKAFYNGHTKDVTGVNTTDYANGCGIGGTVTQTTQPFNNEYEGLECHFCHRQEKQGPLGEAHINNNSNVWFDDELCAGGTEPCRKGPYDYNAPNSPVAAAPHDWEYSTFVREGDFCGTCHNVSSPEIVTAAGVTQFAKTLIDQDGTDTGIAFPIERTYKEWQNSFFTELIMRDGFGESSPQSTELPYISSGQTCQTCHMPKTADTNARGCDQNGFGTRANDLAVHEFAGGNSWMPQVLKSIYTALGRSTEFDLATTNALKMLQQKSALVEIVSNTVNANQLTTQVKITNLTGHKLSTGYPEGRRMWLNLVVKNANGSIFYESGAYDNTTAILDTTGTKIYETLQGIWDSATSTCVTEVNGQAQFHFALNNCVAKDNRIPPLGFTGTTNIEIKPVGITYPANTANNIVGSVNYDITNYSIDVSGATFPLSVTATLKYQSSSKDYIEFLDNESTTNNIPSENAMCNRSQTVGPANQNRAAFMKTLWQNNGKSAPVDMGTDAKVVN